MKLLPRRYDPHQGVIKIDGRPLNDYDLTTLRGAIGFTTQKAQLFSGPIEENIRFGKETANFEEIQFALDHAVATEFIEKLDEGTGY